MLACTGGGRRALIPGLMPPTHYHSQIAEIKGTRKRFKDTHYEFGNACNLRFREIIIYKPTLLYPEYLIAYQRFNGANGPLP